MNYIERNFLKNKNVSTMKEQEGISRISRVYRWNP